MSELSHSLRYLYRDGYIARYNMESSTVAKVFLHNQNSLFVYIADDRYVITLADIMSAANHNPSIDYIIRNAWQEPTSAAYEECKRLNIVMVNYREFQKILQRLDDSIRPHNSLAKRKIDF